MSDQRFTRTHVDQWREEGFAIVPDFFTADEIQPVVADFESLYGDVRARHAGVSAVNSKKTGELGRISARQFQNFDALPYPASPAINLISLHPALISFARALLGVEAVACYQSHSWAKFTGEADYDQAFHCDFGNHTLTVPSEMVQRRTVDFIIYLTDVTDDLGALHYVTKPDANAVLGVDNLTVPDDSQAALLARQRSAASPAGSLVAHSIDTVHRGTNLTRPGGYRYTMTTGYKAAGNDMIGFHVWQVAPQRPWHLILNHATPEQLTVLGIPAPGDPFWTPHTLRQTQLRWPEWSMEPYFQALA